MVMVIAGDLGLNPLEQAVAQRDLILVTGKGGVGKSTVVAALAQLAARRRGGAVAVEFSAHPRLPGVVPACPGLELVNIEIEQALPRSLGRMLHIPAILSQALNNRLLRLFVRTSPAVEEMIQLDEIYTLVEASARRGHPVIVDLHASGHAVSFLDTPRTVRRMLRVGPVAEKARLFEALLHDRQRTELVVVALPEELPVNETIELVQRASELGIAVRSVVVNQVPASSVHAEDLGLIEILRQDGDDQVQLAAGAARDALTGADQARSQIERLKGYVPGPIVELPLCAELDPAQRADRIARAIAP